MEDGSGRASRVDGARSEKRGIRTASSIVLYRIVGVTSGSTLILSCHMIVCTTSMSTIISL